MGLLTVDAHLSLLKNERRLILLESGGTPIDDEGRRSLSRLLTTYLWLGIFLKRSKFSRVDDREAALVEIVLLVQSLRSLLDIIFCHHSSSHLNWVTLTL